MADSSATVEITDSKVLWLYDQSEVEYNANGGTLNPRSQACSTCRWFSHGRCHIVRDYPAEIVSNGWCNKWAEAPQPKPMEVTIVEAEPVLEVGMMEAKPPGIIERVGKAINHVLGRDSPDSVTGFKVRGNHFLATYSGTFQDKDGEYFTTKGADEYIARVEQRLVAPPFLAVWHYINPDTGKGAVIGEVKTVFRIGNFICAAGEFYTDARSQKAREFYANPRNARQTKMSHGFMYDARYKEGNTYHRWNTFEITLLPNGAEAFPYTAFEAKEKDNTMPLSEPQRKYLENIWGKEEVDKMVADREGASKALQDLGLGYKDFTPVQPDTATDTPAPATDEGFKAFLGTLMQDHGTVVQLLQAMDNRINTMQKQLDERNAQIAALQKALAEPVTPASKSDATVVTDAGDTAKATAELAKKSSADNPFGGMFPGLVNPASS